MKKLLIIFFSLCFICSFSQEFSIGVEIPKSSGQIKKNHLKKLNQKLINIINNSGIVTYDSYNDFALYPTISIENTGTIEGGLENLSLVSINLSIYFKQVSTNKSFGYITKKIKGSGFTESEAISNAFAQLKEKDNRYIQFISDCKSKIYDYYIVNCNKIIKNAETQFTMRNYEKAISILYSIPDVGNSCFNKAQQKMMEYYQVYQSKLCKENISKAKAEIAIKNYEQALNFLKMIDTESICYNEAEKLLSQISSNIDKEESIILDLEKSRIEAIKEISKHIYSQQNK